ncbi:MAG: PH domain-containing protein [Nocardioides sp.]
MSDARGRISPPETPDRDQPLEPLEPHHRTAPSDTEQQTAPQSETEPAERPWRRLDSRMLLIGPVRSLKELALPAVVAVIGLSASNSYEATWVIPALVGLLALGLIPWFTTSYRTTGTQFELRQGLINKEHLTAPLDRIRSVDLESSVLLRLLRLTKVQIGTGVDATRITLNAISNADAIELRRRLLARAGPPIAPPTTESITGPITGPTTGRPGIEEDWFESRSEAVPLAVIDWSWLRFAPFSLARLVVVGGLFGALSQLGNDLPLMDVLDAEWRRMSAMAVPVIVAVTLLGALTGWVLLSMGGYVVQWWNLRLVRADGAIRLIAGLLTTRSTTVEEDRIRGVEVSEPVLLRVVGGAELAALATGVGSGGKVSILPPCPQSVALDVGERILDLRDPDESRPLSAPLAPHGAAARRRSYLRAQVVSALWLVAATVLVWTTALPWWPAAVVLLVLVGGGLGAGHSAYRNLGHLLTPEHLVSGSGIVERRRTALEVDGVIGWVIRQSWFQRRAGLATLVATTAAGSEQVAIRDLPLATAIALARRATPGALAPFLATVPAPAAVA